MMRTIRIAALAAMMGAVFWAAPALAAGPAPEAETKEEPEAPLHGPRWPERVDRPPQVQLLDQAILDRMRRRLEDGAAE